LLAGGKVVQRYGER